MPPAPTRTLSQILRSLASKDLELGGFLYPESGTPRRGFYPEGTHKLAGAPVLTGTTVSDKASAAKLLQLARGLPKPEQNKVTEFVKAVLANQEARQAFASGRPVEIFAPQSNIARDLGRRNTLSKEQVLAAVKETLSSPLYKGPSYEELLRIAEGNPLRMLLPPHVVRGAQRRLVSRAFRATAREARARGEAVARPPQKARQRIMDPEEVIREMRETGEGAGGSGQYRPLFSPEKVEPGKASKRNKTQAVLSDILPGLSFEARGGKMFVSWKGQDPVTISEAIKLTANERYTQTLFRGLLGLEEKMRKLSTPAGREAEASQAKRMKAGSRWVEDKDRPSGHVEYAPVAAEKRRETEGVLPEESAREERKSPADARAGLRRWRMGGPEDQPKRTAKRASEKQVELLLSKLRSEGEVTPQVYERVLKELGENPLVAISGLSGNEAAKYINRLIINEEMARTGGIPRAANVSSEYGSKQRIAARNLIARTLEEAGQQRGAEGRAILAEALKKASKQEKPRTAAATALLGMRGMKKLGIDDAQAQLIDALLREPGGDRILDVLRAQNVRRGNRDTPYGKISLVPQPKPEVRRFAANDLPPGSPTYSPWKPTSGPKREIKRKEKPKPPVEVMQKQARLEAPSRRGGASVRLPRRERVDTRALAVQILKELLGSKKAASPRQIIRFPDQPAARGTSDFNAIMQKYKGILSPRDWKRLRIDILKLARDRKRNEALDRKRYEALKNIGQAQVREASYVETPSTVDLNVPPAGRARRASLPRPQVAPPAPTAEELSLREAIRRRLEETGSYRRP